MNLFLLPDYMLRSAGYTAYTFALVHWFVGADVFCIAFTASRWENAGTFFGAVLVVAGLVER